MKTVTNVTMGREQLGVFEQLATSGGLQDFYPLYNCRFILLNESVYSTQSGLFSLSPH